MANISVYYTATVTRTNGRTNTTGFNSDCILSENEVLDRFSYLKEDPTVKSFVLEKPEIIPMSRG